MPGRLVGVVLVVAGAWLAAGSRWAPERILGRRGPTAALSDEGRRDVGRILRVGFLVLGLVLVAAGIADLVDPPS